MIVGLKRRTFYSQFGVEAPSAEWERRSCWLWRDGWAEETGEILNIPDKTWSLPTHNIAQFFTRIFHNSPSSCDPHAEFVLACTSHCACVDKPTMTGTPNVLFQRVWETRGYNYPCALWGAPHDSSTWNNFVKLYHSWLVLFWVCCGPGSIRTLPVCSDS